jgi:hypothetical protein
MPSTCSFGHCPVESAKFENDGKVPKLHLGNPLELKCQFRTGNPMNSTVLDDGGIGIFVWPLNEGEGVEEQQKENRQNATSLVSVLSFNINFGHVSGNWEVGAKILIKH